MAKITGKEGLVFQGRARVFDGEERATAAILDGTVRAGDVVVIRYEGPKGGPGMREMLSPTGALMGRGLGDKCRLDHRWAFLGRQSRLRGWTYRSGGGRGWSHRPASQRGPRHD